jgi:hypothetical protein
MSNRCDKSDLRNWRHPTLAGDPPNRLAGAAVHERFGILLRQAACPFLKPLLGEPGAFGMRTSQRPAKLRATATVQFAAHCLRDEPAAIILQPASPTLRWTFHTLSMILPLAARRSGRPQES